MNIIIRCTACSRQLRVPEEMRGEQVRCPVCDLCFTAPWEGEPDDSLAPCEAEPLPLEEPPAPAPRRSYEEEDDYRPRRSRRRSRSDDNEFLLRGGPEKPGKVQAIAILTLIGGIIGIKVALIWILGAGIPSMGVCCLWPGIYFSLVMGILATVKGAQLLGREDYRQPPPQTTAILQIINIINGDIINCVLGILVLVFLSEPQVRRYYRG